MKNQPIPRYDDIYGSEYVSPEDFPGGKSVTVKILKYEILELTCAKGGRAVKNVKCVFTCENCKKKVACNKTSAKRLALAWGKEFKDWVGKSITVTGGAVNGKPAVLLAPVQAETGGTEPTADDLAFEGEIPSGSNQ